MKVLQDKLCCYFGRTNSNTFKKLICVIKHIPRASNDKKIKSFNFLVVYQRIFRVGSPN